MGCTSSKSKSVADDSAMMRRRGPRASMVAAGVKTEVIKNPAAAEAQRTVATNGTVSLALPASGYALRYAYFSQRGYYPDSPNKTNQDAVSATENLGGSSETHLFAVFDGHGELGTECAQFVTDKIPTNLVNEASLTSDPAQSLHNALVTTNKHLHSCAAIDDSLSGTTACCGLLAGRTLYIANVGDSRAVMAERHGDAAMLVAKDLSQDQTPFRMDECTRVIKAGARVMTLDQLEGIKDPGLPCWTNETECDGDPPRLWARDGMYPGTAFTRSIGDAAAEEIGVIADPETSSTQLGPQYPFLILATDGVWEFISSQKAVDIVSKFDNPYDASRSLVAQAYKLWLQKETRTDDVSCVVLFMDWPQPAAAQADQVQQQQEQEAEAAQALLAAKPAAAAASLAAVSISASAS